MAGAFRYAGGIVSNGNPTCFFDGFYFSVTTAFTVGYDDRVPACLSAKILVQIECAVKLYLISYFIVVADRKALRRSVPKKQSLLF